MVAPKKPGSFAKRLSRLEHMLTALINSLGDEAGEKDRSFEHLMAAPNNPGSFAKRLSRLEHILTALINSLGDEAGEKDRSFEFGVSPQRSQWNERSQPDLHLDSLERQLEKWQRERTFSILPRLEEVRSEVNKLQCKTKSIEIDTHTLLAIQALGLPTDEVRLTRYVPIRAYIDETPAGAIGAVSSAVVDVLKAFGFTVADEFPEIRGSWFKKWFAKSKDVVSQPEVRDRLEKIERAVELKGIGRPQAEVDDIQASAIARLVGALDKVSNAAIQAGSVLVVKLTTPNGQVIQARTLTQEEMVALENNQLLLQDPAKVLGRLSAACTSSRGLPPPESTAVDA
jgi:hypothetical protein